MDKEWHRKLSRCNATQNNGRICGEESKQSDENEKQTCIIAKKKGLAALRSFPLPCAPTTALCPLQPPTTNHFRATTPPTTTNHQPNLLVTTPSLWRCGIAAAAHCITFILILQSDSMKPSKQAKKATLKLLKQSSPKTEKELMDEIVHEEVSQKHVTKALEKLLTKGEIVGKDGVYSLASACRSESSSEVVEQGEPHAGEDAVPFAEILRRRATKQDRKSTESQIKNEKQDDFDIDDEIRRLEAELAADGDESDEYSTGASDEDSVERDRLVSFGAVSVKVIEPSPSKTTGMPSDAVMCFSAVAQERIAPLPERCLPKTKKRNLKGIDEDPQQTMAKKSTVSNGLRDAVKEVLSGYVARSHQRLPFYCRVCAKQYSTEQEFFDHKTTDFHKAAVEEERKLSFCKLCRKQFTSPIQLKEHISSRPHKERLSQMRSQQARHRSRGRNAGEGQAQRQWC